MAIPDPLAAIVAMLKDNSAVAALVSARVYGAELPRSEADSQPRAAVVCALTRSPGGPGSRSYLLTTLYRVDIKAYGGTHALATQLFLAVYDALKNMTRVVYTSTLLHDAVKNAGPLQLRDPDADWPLVFSSYDVLVGDESTA